MAVCSYCNEEMEAEATTSCHGNEGTRTRDGRVWPSVPWDGPGLCGDCNVVAGGFHHPGCDMERCPKCRTRQCIACPHMEGAEVVRIVETV
jgi:hypothetical protein